MIQVALAKTTWVPNSNNILPQDINLLMLNFMEVLLKVTSRIPTKEAILIIRSNLNQEPTLLILNSINELYLNHLLFLHLHH